MRQAMDDELAAEASARFVFVRATLVSRSLRHLSNIESLAGDIYTQRVDIIRRSPVKFLPKELT